MLAQGLNCDYHPMDRPLDTTVLQGRKRRFALKVALSIGAFAALLVFIPALLRPSVRRSDIRTAVVVQGSIEGSISATGTVVPALEQAIASPADTRILAVRKKPGEFVRRGESLLDVDRSEVSLILEKTGKDLSLADNKRTQLKLDLERTLNDLQGQLTIKDVRLKFLHSKTEQGEKMFALGAISKDQLDQTHLEEQVATVEEQELRQSIESTRKSLENQLEGMTTEIRSLVREKEEIQRQLDLMLCRPGQDGVVTWVNDRVGTAVHRGEVMAKVADLRSYCVDAEVSDIHVTQLEPGMPARIRLNAATITGRVRTVYPAVENGVAKVSIDLDNASDAALRPNLRVDVALITSRRDSTLVVRRGPFAAGEGVQQVFVVRGNIAVRTEVRLGVSNFDSVEIAGGCSRGDEIILSDMTEYAHLAQIALR